MALRKTSITCIKCKNNIKLANDISPFSQVNCPRCQYSASYRELQMHSKATAKKFADELMSKLYKSETEKE